MNTCYIPEGYRPALERYDLQRAIEFVKSGFQENLKLALNLRRVSAPLFVERGTGLNDDLSGAERPVAFDIPAASAAGEVVHSLAKWKRLALQRYGFRPGTGLYTDMNAIRRDERSLDNLHSVYVDQWDWEKIILPEERNAAALQSAVRSIVGAVCDTSEALGRAFPQLDVSLERHVTFLTSQELEDRYPDLSPGEREDAAVREHKTVFLMGIGAPLRSGKPHDLRAPDYDDWALNGDILLWDAVLERTCEISSMGIRVDGEALRRQLEAAGCPERAQLPFHRMLLDGELPLTMGGGIGQSRLCKLMTGCCHIGEVQASLWDKETLRVCREAGVPLL